MSEQALHEEIEAYLAGTLDAEAHAQMEARIQAEPAFAEAVALHREVAAAINDEDEQNLEAMLVEVSEDHRGSTVETGNPRRRMPTYLLAAASVALLCVIGWLIFRPVDPPLST
ncbi:MAG: hypothetical protein AAF570_19645, partial [Bacteroidota bacterium]